jgi:predicted transcriptional regulator
MATVVSLLDDEYARSILTATSIEPMSAKELSERCDASLPTIYRRVEDLTEAGLLTERTRPRPDGHHYSVYAADLDRLTIDLEDGEFAFDLERRSEDVADRLTRMWEEL